MTVITYQLGQLETNCYLLIKGSDCLLIDPADEAGFILEILQQKKLTLIGLLATHGHFDHIGAAGEIQFSTDVPLFIHKKDQFLIDRLNETARYFLGYDPHYQNPSNIKYLKEGRINVSSFKLQVIHTPGHTPGSCSFYFPDEKILFSGDTLFKQGIGRYDFSYSHKQDLTKSLLKLIKLPKETIVYAGHGEATSISKEMKCIKMVI